MEPGPESRWREAVPNQTVAEPAPGRRGWHLFWLVVIVAVAALLRAYRLGEWPMADDEIYTLRDSRTMSTLLGPKPLLFFLHYHLFGPDGLTELTMRILPAVFGVLSVPAVYWVTRRVATPAAGLVAAFLVAVHPEHVYWSQFARYYSLAFLMTTLYPFAFYWAVRERRWTWAFVGILAAAVGGLAHPSSLLPLGAVGLWGVYELSRTRKLSRRQLAWILVVAVAVIASALTYALPILERWIALPERLGFGSVGMQISHLNALTPALVIGAGLGLAWLVRPRATRSLGVLLGLWYVVPAAFLSVIALFASAYTGYLWPTAPAFFVAASLFVDRSAAAVADRFTRRLARVALVAMMVLTALPSLMSHYMDGSRSDFRAPAELVLERSSPGDVVLADQHELSYHYLDGAEGLTFDGLGRDEATLARAMQGLRSGGDGSDLWIIAETVGRGGIGDKTLAAAGPWVRAHCYEVATFGRYRLDYKRNATRLHRCPVAHEAHETEGP